MATTTLNAYLNELKTLLERESATEVVAHCRYILQQYPHNVETYRLLGKALLQKGHHEGQDEYFDEAANIFQRVLSVSPNDHIAHLGLSEVREMQAQLEQAIWHMERAYEQKPGNTLLQQALHRLYVKRDGADQTPTKIQLTRAALARQHANGQFYDQALIELRAALEQFPERLDLELLLVEILWESRYTVEAAEAALAILKKLPNCLAANRIMALLWLEYERPTDAQLFLNRIEALDPYEAARIVGGEGRWDDPNVLTRLDYTSRAAARMSTETPDWVQELGDLGSMFQSEPEPPETHGMGFSTGPDRIDTDSVFGDSAPRSDMPAWMDQMSFGQTEPATDESQQAFEADWLGGQPIFQAETPRDQDLPPADIPDWFAEVVKDEPAPSQEPLDQAPVESDWLQTDAEQEESPLVEDDHPPSGFTDLLQGVEARRAQYEPGEDNASGEPTPPDWLGLFEEDGLDVPAEASLPGDMGDVEALSWSGELPQDGDMPADLPAIADLLAAELPAEIGEDISESDESMGWLSGFEHDLPSDIEKPDSGPIAQEFTGADDSAPDWMQSLDLSEDVFSSDMQDVSEIAPDLILPDEVQPGVESVLPTAGQVEESADWLTEPEYDFFAPATEQAEETGIVDERLPDQGADWLADFGDFDDSQVVDAALDRVPSEPDRLADAGEPIDSGLDGGEMAVAAPDEALAELDWLAGAGELVDGGEIVASTPDETLAELDWLTGSGELVDDGEIVASAPDEALAELDWLAGAGEPIDADLLAALDSVPTGDRLPEDFAVADSTPDWGEALEFEIAEPDKVSDLESAPALDWLQQEPAEDDWSGALAVEDGDPIDAILQGEDATLLDAAGWMAQMPEIPVVDDAEALSFDEMEAAMFGATPGQAEIEPPSPTASDDQAPAWMAEIEPAESDTASEISIEEPYDPFEGGSPDQVPEYRSARTTGILQPDELPDWMTAFTGEELPPEESVSYEEEPEAVSEPFTLDAFNFETDLEEDIPAAEADAPEEVQAEAELLEEDAEGLPGWLAAITSSEADKLDDFFAEDVEPALPEESADVFPSGKPLSLDEQEPFSFETEIAYPDDLAHTDAIGLEIETDDSFSFDQDDEPVPDDFSFDDQEPAWLRRPQEYESDTFASAADDIPSETPDWLRNAFEDDETID